MEGDGGGGDGERERERERENAKKYLPAITRYGLRAKQCVNKCMSCNRSGIRRRNTVFLLTACSQQSPSKYMHAHKKGSVKQASNVCHPLKSKNRLEVYVQKIDHLSLSLYHSVFLFLSLACSLFHTRVISLARTLLYLSIQSRSNRLYRRGPTPGSIATYISSY